MFYFKFTLNVGFSYYNIYVDVILTTKKVDVIDVISNLKIK